MLILIADDDDDDKALIQEAIIESRLGYDLVSVNDGEDLLDYLNHKGRYTGLTPSLPDLILLDLNMPRKDGREALKEIRSDLHFKNIPVVILTTSNRKDDIEKCYSMGANSFITKPVIFSDLVKVVNTLDRFWPENIKLAG